MSTSAIWWLSLNLLSIAISAFYSMMEMASVSFNKVRLQYYVSKGIKQAIWLNELLQDPSRLFGTTLIGVNITLVIGSECSREFYSALGFNPDFAPLTQVVMVVILGELAPMFAARRYSEHVVMLGLPFLYASSQIMKPLLIVISWISKFCHFFIGGSKSESELFLTQEELVKILESKEDEYPHDEFQDIAANILKLRHLLASDIMKPLSQYKLLASNATIKDMRSLLEKSNSGFYPIYHRNISNIVSIAYPRDMLRATENKRVRDFSKSPWFITLNTSVMEVLEQFKRNRQNVAIIINNKGSAIGVITLDILINEVITSSDTEVEECYTDNPRPQIIIDCRLPADMTVGQFNQKFGVKLDENIDLTLSQLICLKIGTHPEEGDSIFIDPYQITVSEVSLTEIKQVTVSTKII